MSYEITIKNYRCFSDSNPATIRLGNGYTAFVGVNNSGKSTLLRMFYEFRQLFARLIDFTARLRDPNSDLPLPKSVSDRNEIFNNSNQRDLVLVFSMSGIVNLPDEYSRLPAPDQVRISIQRSGDFSTTLIIDGTEIETQGKGIEWKKDTDRQVISINNVLYYVGHIPKMFNELSNSMYIGPFRNALAVKATERYFDMRVGIDFVTAWKNFKSGPNKKQNELAYELTGDLREVFEYSDLEINPSEDNLTFQVFVDGKSYRLLKLGAGLSQFILVITQVAMRRPYFVFIDEPESNLHPKLQFEFLSLLIKYALSGVVIATHNIGLARAYADFLYSVRILEDGRRELRELESTPRLSEFLGELSYSEQRELGFDKVLLVEGRTDVKVFQVVLRKMRKGSEFVILPLGGSDMINKNAEDELTEIKRICGKVYAIIDSEKNKYDAKLSSNRIEFRDICKRLGIKCRVMTKRAIENYFPDNAVKAEFGQKFGALRPYKKMSEAEQGWAKRDNWRIVSHMTRDDIAETDFGKFLRRIK